jgi:tetratricopeptide (TPR) repeat protein
MTTPALQQLGPLLEGVEVPAPFAGVVETAMRALASGRADEAARSLEGAYAAEQDPVLAYLLGVAHLARADVYRAGPALDAAVVRAPGLWMAHLARALVLEVMQDFDAAADALRRVLQARAEHVGAIAALARCYNHQGKLDRAEALSRRGLELAPRDAALLAALADTLRRQDRHGEAVEVLRAVLGVEAGHEDAAVALGGSLLRLHRPGEAQAIFEDVLRRNGESTGALAGMAEALQSEGRLGEAQGYLLRALAAAPDLGWLHLLHARLQARMNNAAAAENSANMAATLEPGEPEALRIGIWACRELRRFDDSALYAERLLVLVPDDAEAIAARALSRVLRGEAASVLSELTPRMNGERTPPDVILALGCAQFALGRPRQAADLFVQVLRHRERDTLAQRLVGWAYELVGNPTTDALALLRVRLAEPDVRPLVPGALAGVDVRPPVRDAWDDGRVIGRRVTGPIQPIVEVAVNALLAPDRPPGATPVHGMPAIARLTPSGGMPVVRVHAVGGAPPVPAGVTPGALGGHTGARDARPAARPGTGSLPAIAVATPAEVQAAAATPASAVAPASISGDDDGVESQQGGGEAVSVLTHVGEREVSDLREILRRLHRVVSSDVSLLGVAIDLERLIEDLDQPMVLAILGPRGAGKTSFVNALIGREVIPPATSAAHLLRYGRHPVGRILYRDGRIETVRFQDLTGFLAANAAELTPEVVQLVEILYPIEELTKASILDVPEASLERRDDPLLADADAIIWLVGVDQPPHHWKDAERWLAERPMDAIAIVSRVEGHDPTQVEAAVNRARMTLGGAVEEVLPVSAKVALHGLRTKNVEELRRAGIARLHRVLKRQFFLRSAWIKARAGRARARKLLAHVVGLVEDRHVLLAERATALTALVEQVALDRARVRAEIEEDTPPRLQGAISAAVEQASRDLAEILRENRGQAGRAHVVRAIRARVEAAVGDAVERVREMVDARLEALTDTYLDQLEAVFPPAEDSPQSQRILGLRGLLDGFRQVLLEQTFGRHQAYLEGWVDQSPLELLFEDDGFDPTPAQLAHALRTRALRLESARPVRLDDLAEPLFEGVSGFAEESLAELRAAALELTKALREPLRAVNLREDG